jgi:predicted nucleic acid-binding protein
MSYVVLDASYIFGMIAPHPAREVLQARVDDWRRNGVVRVTPLLAMYELTSAISKDVHFSRMSEEAARMVLNHALQLEIELLMPDASQITAAFGWARRLNRAAAYDGFYLALAESLGC